MAPTQSHDPAPFTSSLTGTPIVELRVATDGDRVIKLADVDAREDLLARIAAGKLVEIEVEAVTYRQTKGQNRNFFRFAKGTLRDTAHSFRDKVVLLDHEQRDTRARIGTIRASTAKREFDADGNVVALSFHQTLRIVEPSGVAGVLRGTLDRLSIGWLPTGPVTCSVHGKRLPRSWADFDSSDAERLCLDCLPGDEVDGKVVEAVFNGAEGVETSFVNVPAVAGTSVENIRAAMAAHFGGRPPRRAAMDRIRQSLGLADTASDQEVAAAITAQAERLATLATREKELAAQAAELATARAAAEASHRDGTIERLYAEGRLAVERDAAGHRVVSAHERSLRALPVDQLVQLAASMPRLQDAPLAAGELQTRQPGTSPPRQDNPSALANNPHLPKMLASLGITEEEYRQFGPHHREVQDRDEAPIPRCHVQVYRSRETRVERTGRE